VNRPIAFAAERVSIGPIGHDRTVMIGEDRTQRFRDAALPHLDDAYTLARYLLGNASDAEDAVQECCLRAFRHFDGFRGGAIKPWLLAILRNVCRAEYSRRAGIVVGIGDDADEPDGVAPLWNEARETPETEVLRRLDGETMQRLITALPPLFREVIVLREINDLSYREIANVIDTPVGTVMSRLARARSLLREGWIAAEKGSPT
jgi:RNA polymerase sigma-70 factor (ECF subfamily)